jgi:methylmalonyl-CoA mutase
MENLFPEFDAATKEDWLRLVVKELKGKPAEELHWAIGAHGLRIEPMYTEAEFARFPAPLPANLEGWLVGETITASDISSAREKLMGAVAGGVDSPCLDFAEPLQPKDSESIFEGMGTDRISFFFKTALSGVRSFQQVFTSLRHTRTPSAGTRCPGGFYCDLLAGDFSGSELLHAFSEWKAVFPDYRFFVVDGRHSWKGSDAVVEELTTLSQLTVQVVEHLAQAGVSIGEIQRHVFISCSTGTSYFLEIAKLRALKLLVGNIFKAYGAPQSSIPFVDIHFAPATQAADPYAQIIRSTTQAMAAIIGGADRLTVLPGTMADGQQEQFTRRIARNVQHILRLEAQFGKVADPAAGSYYIEQLTTALCQQVWQRLG